MAEPIDMPFELWSRVGPGNHVLDGGPNPPMGRGEKWCTVVKYRDTVVSCAKTAELIEMPFRLWTLMGPINHVLDGCPQVLRDVAMTASFGTHFALTGYVGYKFGCMIASDRLFASRGGFLGSGSSHAMKI